MKTTTLTKILLFWSLLAAVAWAGGGMRWSAEALERIEERQEQEMSKLETRADQYRKLAKTGKSELRAQYEQLAKLYRKAVRLQAKLHKAEIKFKDSKKDQKKFNELLSEIHDVESELAPEDLPVCEEEAKA